MDEIEALLANILADKPLPPAAPATITKPAAAPQAKPQPVSAAQTDDEILAALLRGEEPAVASPADVTAHTELMSEVVLDEAAGVTQGVTEPAAPAPAAVFADTAVRTTGPAITMPEFVGEDFAETMDIRQFATLVTLQTSRWQGKVKDRQASKDVAAANDADERGFETRKLLLAGADGPLKNIHRIIDEARAAHYDMTLPWSTTGMNDTGRRSGGRLLPNTKFVDYTTVMAHKLQEMKAAVAAFIPLYPELMEEAKKRLGRRFDAREYPNPSAIAEHFSLSFDFQPIPKGDDFMGLPQVQLDALARKVNENTRLMAEHAMQDLWVRIHEPVAHMATMLGDPNKKFHATLVDNVRTITSLIPHLNITRDPKVESIRQKMEKHLIQHDAKALRENATLRLQVAAHAASIVQEMAQ